MWLLCKTSPREGTRTAHVCFAVFLSAPGAAVSSLCVCRSVVPLAQSSVCRSNFACLMFSITVERALKLLKMTGEVPTSVELKNQKLKLFRIARLLKSLNITFFKF